MTEDDELDQGVLPIDQALSLALIALLHCENFPEFQGEGVPDELRAARVTLFRQWHALESDGDE